MISAEAIEFKPKKSLFGLTTRPAVETQDIRAHLGLTDYYGQPNISRIDQNLPALWLNFARSPFRHGGVLLTVILGRQLPEYSALYLPGYDLILTRSKNPHWLEIMHELGHGYSNRINPKIMEETTGWIRSFQKPGNPKEAEKRLTQKFFAEGHAHWMAITTARRHCNPNIRHNAEHYIAEEILNPETLKKNFHNLGVDLSPNYTPDTLAVFESVAEQGTKDWFYYRSGLNVAAMAGYTEGFVFLTKIMDQLINVHQVTIPEATRLTLEHPPKTFQDVLYPNSYSNLLFLKAIGQICIPDRN